MASADRLINLFHETLAFPKGPERQRFLAEVCQEDIDLRNQVLSLIQAHECADGFLQNTINSPMLTAIEKPGDRIGRYRLIELLGEGGYGVVYVAEQEMPVRRRVALKVIKLGMDTRQVVARFEAERQALALMDHPNIAKVFDAGATETGRPYFVMELVKGIRMTDFCDQNQHTTRDRLELFIQVCQAIQHAHQKGVIHRDIKPSNILVARQDGRAIPKVIDFGIAKATEARLTDVTVHTQLHQFIGTPAYMSPEQAGVSADKSCDIDTRSDIYSLGVLLYELLAGSTPFDTRELIDSGIDAMLQTIREKEPIRPSTRLAKMRPEQLTRTAQRRGAEAPQLIHLLKGDLDWIVMKCLEKDRTRRYETANGLASDVRRFLNHEPVLARPPSTIYRISKSWQRNKLAYASAAAVAMALILGAAVSGWHALRATHAQRQAEKNLYGSDMLLACQALSGGNLGRTRELLARHWPRPRGGLFAPRDLRGWEWRYLWERARGDPSIVLRGHANSVPMALMLRDGRTIFSASKDRTLKFWDLETRDILASLPYPDEPRRPTLSPNGQMIAVDGQFGRWCVLDAHRHSPLHSATNDFPVLSMAFSPDNQLLAVGGVDAITLHKTGSWEPVRKIPRSDPGSANRLVIALAFTPDGTGLAYSRADDRIVIHDVKTKEETPVGTSSRGEALSLCFTHEGTHLVSADRERISIWQVSPPALLKHLTNHIEQVLCLALSPDGAWLASASGDQTLKLWNTTSWEEVATLRGHENEVYGVAFSPDGHKLISSGKDDTIRIWETPSSLSKSIRIPLSNFDRLLPLRPTTGRAFGLNFKEGRATLVNLLKSESYPQELPPAFKAPAAFCLSPDASAAAVGLEKGEIEIWMTEPFHRQRVLHNPHGKPIFMAWSESRQWLATAQENGWTHLWDLDQERIVKTLPPLSEQMGSGNLGRSSAMSFWSKDRRLARFIPATRGSREKIDICLLTEKEQRLILSTHKDNINDFAISHDGTIMATSSWDNTIKLWDIRTGLDIDTLRGQMVGFTSVSFSPDDSRLVAGGWDGSITIWDTSNRQMVATWKAHYRRSLTHFLDQDEVLLTVGEHWSGSGYGLEASLWRAPTVADIEAVEAHHHFGKQP